MGPDDHGDVDRHGDELTPVTVWLLDVGVLQRWTIGTSILSAMFAVVVVSKIVRDREEAQRYGAVR